MRQHWVVYRLLAVMSELGWTASWGLSILIVFVFSPRNKQHSLQNLVCVSGLDSANSALQTYTVQNFPNFNLILIGNRGHAPSLPGTTRMQPTKCLTRVRKTPCPCPLRQSTSYATLIVTDSIFGISSPQSAPYPSGASHMQLIDSLAAVPETRLLYMC